MIAQDLGVYLQTGRGRLRERPCFQYVAHFEHEIKMQPGSGFVAKYDVTRHI